MQRSSKTLLAALACLVLGSEAEALPTFSGNSHGAGTPVSIFNSTSPILETRSATEAILPNSSGTGGGTFVGSSTTGAGFGFLKAASSSDLTWTGTGGNGVDVAASAGFNLDDIVITGPGGTPANTLVHYAFDFTLSGEIDASLLSSSPALWGIGATVGLSFSDVNAPGFGGNLGQMAVSFNNGVKATTQNGVFTGFPSGSFTNVTGTTAHDNAGADTRGVTTSGGTVSVGFFLTTDANVGKESFDPLTGEGMAFADFARTLLFSTTGPVLAFTDAAGNPLTGWTANSSDGCIVDNHYTCAPPETPEPAEIDLLGVGLVGLGVMTRKRFARLI